MIFITFRQLVHLKWILALFVRVFPFFLLLQFCVGVSLRELSSAKLPVPVLTKSSWAKNYYMSIQEIWIYVGRGQKTSSYAHQIILRQKLQHVSSRNPNKKKYPRKEKTLPFISGSKWRKKIMCTNIRTRCMEV